MSRWRAAPPACALATAALTAAAAHAAPTRCPGGEITVDAPEPAQAERICRAAEAAATRLSRCGLPLPGPVEIVLGASLPAGCMGLYHCGEGRIDLLTPEAFAASRSAEAPSPRCPRPPTTTASSPTRSHMPPTTR
jgi:hypothetical protein